MKRQYSASITYDTTGKHPDIKNAKGLVFDDVYTIDTDTFMGYDSIDDYITEDLLLVAGGGYDWDNVSNYKVKIVGV